MPNRRASEEPVNDAKAHLERLTKESVHLRFDGKSKAIEYLAKQPRGSFLTTCVKRGRNGSFYFKIFSPDILRVPWMPRSVSKRRGYAAA